MDRTVTALALDASLIRPRRLATAKMMAEPMPALADTMALLRLTRRTMTHPPVTAHRLPADNPRSTTAKGPFGFRPKRAFFFVPVKKRRRRHQALFLARMVDDEQPKEFQNIC